MPNKVLQPWMVFIKLIITISFLSVSVVYASVNTEGIQVYQKNLHLSSSHKKKLAADISRYKNADNIWDVLREQFSLQHYERHPLVRERIEWYMNNQDFLLRAASRAAPYLYYISQQVHKRHLPAEIVLLPIIESGYNPFALSNMGALGLWQIMPDTASGFGIKQNYWYDGRRDIIASTRGALDYLVYLQTFFEGNWLLALAAYNTGEGNVLAAIKRNIRNGRRTDFWSLPVAHQTRDYVPSLLALATIISHPEQYRIYFPPVRNAPYLAQVDVGKQINLKFAASLAGLSYKKLIQLNPGYNPNITSIKKGPYKLVLPIENVEQFSENLARSPINTKVKWSQQKNSPNDALAQIKTKKNIMNIASSFKNIETPQEPKVTTSQGKYLLQPGDTIYMIRNQDTIDSIAKKFHISSQTLIAANDLNGSVFSPGKHIVIPTHASNDSSTASPSNDNIKPGDTIYMVRKGDTIEKIALKFGLTPSEIRVVNLMEKRPLTEGESLIIPNRVRG